MCDDPHALTVCVRSQTEVKQFSVQSLQSDLNAEDDKAQVCPLKALNTISFTLASWGESESQAPAQIRQGSLKHTCTHTHTYIIIHGRVVNVYTSSSKQAVPCLGVKPSTVTPERIVSLKKKINVPKHDKQQPMMPGGGGGREDLQLHLQR